MSIAKLQASLAQATNEVTFAAANLNFDFCLVKYEAPKEYQPIGKILSTSRKQDAEHGRSHVTARRLAALFEGVCPDTPNLIKAYGERVSEISKQATDRESKEYFTSLFGPYAGVDATSIWAAATSSDGIGTGAIHIHLLACVLAALFDAAEATSIWAELVEERRKAVTLSWERDERIPFSVAAAAAQQEIKRAQLAEWDSSARAWLQTADAVMRKQQTQLRLILKNIKLSIGSETTVYLGVVDAWKKTLKTMEWLVSGVPQEVQDGTAILGLAAWHIYPDISVFGSRNVDIYMKDPLVAAGGVLSLGCSPSATTPSSGVSWSLSLAQLNYYGQAVPRQGSFKTDDTRITFKELMLVTLGCILAQWDIPIGQTETSEAIEFIELLSRNAIKSSGITKNGERIVGLQQKVEGLRLLAEAAEAFSKSPNASLRFVNLGRNRPQFIPLLSHDTGSTKMFSSPYFGLKRAGDLLKAMRNAEGRIQFLRRMAAKVDGLDRHACVIQYIDKPGIGVETVNFATVFRSNSSSPVHAAKRAVASHLRWLHLELTGMRVPGEILLPNDRYIASPEPKITCTDQTQHSEKSVLNFWYGDWEQAAIYVHRDSSLLSNPKITEKDLLWCLQHDLLSPESFMFEIKDAVILTLQCLATASMVAFRTISGPIVQVQTLEKPMIHADCMAKLGFSSSQSVQRDNAQQHIFTPSRTISILSYLVAGHDIPYDTIPHNIIGMSVGDSIFVPEKMLCDPISPGNKNFTRILGNIGRPGFVMFFSVENPILPPRDNTFWRVADPQKFDGSAANLFHDTSMHLSFTNWERPLEGFSPRGNQDVQLVLMESVISIRERGTWIGDVDVIPALQSPTIYQLPQQSPCNHSVPEPPDIQMTSIESWDELREFHAGNAVVRANGNWLARLATTAYLAQYAEKSHGKIKRITLCPPLVCWKCMKNHITQFSANIYIY